MAADPQNKKRKKAGPEKAKEDAVEDKSEEKPSNGGDQHIPEISGGGGAPEVEVTPFQRLAEARLKADAILNQLAIKRLDGPLSSEELEMQSNAKSVMNRLSARYETTHDKHDQQEEPGDERAKKKAGREARVLEERKRKREAKKQAKKWAKSSDEDSDASEKETEDEDDVEEDDGGKKKKRKSKKTKKESEVKKLADRFEKKEEEEKKKLNSASWKIPDNARQFGITTIILKWSGFMRKALGNDDNDTYQFWRKRVDRFIDEYRTGLRSTDGVSTRDEPKSQWETHQKLVAWIISSANKEYKNAAIDDAKQDVALLCPAVFVAPKPSAWPDSFTYKDYQKADQEAKVAAAERLAFEEKARKLSSPARGSSNSGSSAAPPTHFTPRTSSPPTRSGIGRDQCSYCKGLGHWARECPAKPGGESGMVPAGPRIHLAPSSGSGGGSGGGGGSLGGPPYMHAGGRGGGGGSRPGWSGGGQRSWN
jgi:hypothetical protein